MGEKISNGNSPSFEFLPLPPESEPHFSIERGLEVAEALRRLPFVDSGRISASETHNYISRHNVTIPVERILATGRGMSSWAADDTEKRLSDGRTVPGLQHALQLPYPALQYNPSDPIRITPFEDRRGQIWGAVSSGVHRVIFAKAAGVPVIDVSLRLPAEGEPMPRYDGDILEEFSQ